MLSVIKQSHYYHRQLLAEFNSIRKNYNNFNLVIFIIFLTIISKRKISYQLTNIFHLPFTIVRALLFSYS